jgi:DNA polymerase-3 subunit delta'
MIIGHSKIIKLLARSIEKNNFSQAYIFSGPIGVGKFTVAMDFAKKLTGQENGKINPDIIIIEPEIEEKRGVLKKRDIKIEKIRDLQHRAALSSSGEKHTVIIIDDAQKLNKSAQNALLKTLEEPNEKVLLILVVQDEKKILPTISSRCQRIRFGLVSESELEKAMDPGDKNKKEILFWSLGRPGLMINLIQNKEELDFRNESYLELSKLSEKSVTDKFSLADKLSKNVDVAGKKLDLWSVILRESILGRISSDTIEKNKALEMLKGIENAAGLIKNTNSNPKLVLENLFLIF